MQRPNWTVGSTTYAFSGKVYIAHKTLIDEVWTARDYVSCIQYTESDVNALIGDFGSQFGRGGYQAFPKELGYAWVAWQAVGEQGEVGPPHGDKSRRFAKARSDKHHI
jgi:hypothetical protein